MKKRFISHIPGEIVTQILLHLPFESILTCKLVSNQWRNLISDPKFFKLYNPRGSLCLFLYTDDLYCLITRLHNKISGTVEGPEHPPFTVHRVPIDLRLGIWSECPTKPHLPSGSSNGIACVRRARGDFVLHNLFHRTSFIVDEFVPPTSRVDNGYISWHCFGFGYNIVVAYMTYQHNPGYRGPSRLAVQVEGKEDLYCVYSVRDAVWKQLKGFPYAPYSWYQSYSRQACAIDGMLHWLVLLKATEPNEPVIVTYDLHTRRFGTISLPHDFGLMPHIYGNRCAPMVAELDGQLCCWRFWNGHYDLDCKFKMWVMKEYGASDSWAELISLEETIGGNNSKANYNTTTRVCQLMINFEPTGVVGLYEGRNGGKQLLFISHNYKRALCWYDIDNDTVKVIARRSWSSREGNVLSRRQDFGYANKFLQ